MAKTEGSPAFNYGGGPHGLGDPNDRSLRKSELNILIPKKMRINASKKCFKEFEALQECCAKSGLLLVSRCKVQNNAMLDCITGWYNDEQFKAECTNEYLEERARYRLTGIGEKDRQMWAERKTKFKNMYE